MLENLQEFITPETIAVFVIAFVLVFLIFMSVMHNKIQGLDHRVDDLNDSIKRSVSAYLGEMGEMLQTDVAKSRTGLSDQLDKLGDSWKDSLSSSVAEVNSQIVQLKKEVDAQLAEFSSKFSSDTGEQTAELIERVGNLRDQHSTEVSQYHKALLAQVRERADAEQEQLGNATSELKASLDTGVGDLGHKVDANLGTIAAGLDSQLREGLAGMQGIFETFAGKVDEITAARLRIEELSKNVESLAALLDDRRGRGAVGEVVIASVVGDSLAPSDYELDAVLSNGSKADCLLKLPSPTGNIAITSSIDITDLEQLGTPNADDEQIATARIAFGTKLAEAIDRAAAELIIPDETAPGAVLLLPSETAFTEAHIHHRDIVERAHRNRVWLASPSNLVALVTVARSVIKDSRAQIEADYLHDELRQLENRFNELNSHLAGFARKIEDLNFEVTAARTASRNIQERFGTIAREAPSRLPNK